MATYQIRSRSIKKYRVLVKSGRKHAKTVLRNLLDDTRCPNDLKLRRKWL